VYRLINSHA